ncbi:hypothetical protein [Bacillus sp. FJAT-45350]|uniref:hypothetical protein n=1 Tax=Bacillus sp. FJAT-45350 TaxID=2011014 RepID=UPI000BB81ADC|nr:hypothetical protein [Bacillus sp. FJAT-45350]
MQELYAKIQEYLNMDEEISFKEFSEYYKKVIDNLGADHESFEEDDVWKALFIIESIMSNAESREKEQKGSEAKKYKKMAERCQLWAKNFTARLANLGYTEEDINERFEQMFEEGPVKA